MKKIYFLILLILIIKTAFPQTTYFTLIDDDNYHKPWDILVKTDGNVVFCTNYNKSYDRWSSIYEIDNTGDIVNDLTFIGSDMEFTRVTRMLEINSYIYLFSEIRRILSGNRDSYISRHKLDMQLNEIDCKTYKYSGLTFDNLTPRKVIYKDSTFHVFCYLNINQWESCGYMKIGLSGTKFFEAYHISTTGQALCPHDFLLSPGSDKLFTVCEDHFYTLNTVGKFTEFDTNMTIVSQYPIPDSFPTFCCLKESDSSMYIANNSIMDPQGAINSVINRLDMRGNVLNQFIIEPVLDSASHMARFNSLDTLSDGNLIFCTTWNLDHPLFTQPEPTKIMLFKLRPNLDLIWQKYLFGRDGMYEAYSMKAHPDGGIVILGTFSPTPPTTYDIKEVFLMKTDSVGLLTGISENEQQIKTTEAIIYPNPASDFINIEFSMLYHKATFSLTDITGKTALVKQLTANRQSINISSIPAGTYVYRIFNKDGLDERGKVVVE